MIVYFVVLVAVTLAVNLAERARGRLGSSFLYTIAFATLVLFGGLRSSDVGSDAKGYVGRFGRIAELADVWRQGVEPGVPLLSWLGKRVYDNYVTLFTLVAIVVTLCFLLGIRKLSVNPTVSAFALLTSGVSYFSFNGARQGIAIAICFLAISAIRFRKLWVFLILVAVACFFHLSALVVLPAYFVVPEKSGFRYSVLLVSLVAIAVVMFSSLVEVAARVNPRVLSYGAPVSSGRGLVSAAYYCSLGVFFLYFRRHVQEHATLYSLLLNTFLLGLVVIVTAVIMGTGASGISRLAGYFTASQILLWPIVFANVQDLTNRTTVLLLFVILYLVYHAMTLQAFGNMVPYAFNPLAQGWFSALF